MIVEERIYRIRNGGMARFLALVRDEALPLQQPVLGNLLGYFTTEIGVLSQVVHWWGYADLEDRRARRQRLADDARWQAFVPRLSEWIEHAENRILVPTAFSPLRALPAAGDLSKESRA
ncbi:NIPSNAP family protein [Burkholderia sp. Ac-20379]|uniref:NIPSNAP family protein n=1 Tax=Burkholderia sp. Ac-20379 TaxID=2703900 RepID=UPI0019800419|nr:NIPSNAP family protein [Burkholderia sp. Ac-20379]MBN3726244.1 NIPSNAP family protein [Burkholderia sp. Ac-20379]